MYHSENRTVPLQRCEVWTSICTEFYSGIAQSALR